MVEFVPQYLVFFFVCFNSITKFISYRGPWICNKIPKKKKEKRRTAEIIYKLQNANKLEMLHFRILQLIKHWKEKYEKKSRRLFLKPNCKYFYEIPQLIERNCTVCVCVCVCVWEDIIKGYWSSSTSTQQYLFVWFRQTFYTIQPSTLYNVYCSHTLALVQAVALASASTS